MSNETFLSLCFFSSVFGTSFSYLELDPIVDAPSVTTISFSVFLMEAVISIIFSRKDLSTLKEVSIDEITS